MQKYLRLMKHLAREFDRVEFAQISQSQNVEADELAKQALLEAGSTSMDLKMEV